MNDRTAIAALCQRVLLSDHARMANFKEKIMTASSATSEQANDIVATSVANQAVIYADKLLAELARDTAQPAQPSQALAAGTTNLVADPVGHMYDDDEDL